MPEIGWDIANTSAVGPIRMTSNLFDLSSRRALVTGSSQGIGLAIARGLAEHGAQVLVNGRRAANVDAVVEGLQRAGLHAQALPFDVTDVDAVNAAVERVEREIGPIDILVNNAGMQYRAPLEDFPHDKWDDILRLNVTSIFNVSQCVGRRMIGRRAGKIINIASVQSELARPSIAPYTMSKGAVRNLTRGMATDWARHGIQVNAIAPGYFRTPLNQALVDSEEFSHVAGAANTRRALGRRGGTRRRGRLPCGSRFVIRQRAGALCRRRHHRVDLSLGCRWRSAGSGAGPPQALPTATPRRGRPAVRLRSGRARSVRPTAVLTGGRTGRARPLRRSPVSSRMMHPTVAITVPFEP